MNKNLKLIIGVIILVAAIIAAFFVYRSFKPKAQQGSKGYTIEVVDNNGETKTYEGRTDAEFLKQVMDELAKDSDFSYEGEDSEFGLFIQSVNGLKADYETDGAYWAIYVNGEYGSYGADSQPVADGDTFRFAYEKA